MDGKAVKKKILKMADCIDQILGKSHRVTIPNAKRYVTRGVLKDFSIRQDTVIDHKDWETAVAIVRQRRAKALKPIEPLPKRELPNSTPWKERYSSSLERVFANGYLNKQEYELRRRLLETHPYEDQFFQALKSL